MSGLMSAFFFNDTATTEIYTLSLHDALPILARRPVEAVVRLDEADGRRRGAHDDRVGDRAALRSEEHTSELQSRENLVCRLLLEKKNKTTTLPLVSKERTSSGLTAASTLACC